jgi:hypothetical protein
MECIICDSTNNLCVCDKCKQNICLQCCFKIRNRRCPHCRNNPMTVTYNGEELNISEESDEESEPSPPPPPQPVLTCTRCHEQSIYFRNTVLIPIVCNDPEKFWHNNEEYEIEMCDQCIRDVDMHFFFLCDSYNSIQMGKRDLMNQILGRQYIRDQNFIVIDDLIEHMEKSIVPKYDGKIFTELCFREIYKILRFYSQTGLMLLK